MTVEAAIVFSTTFFVIIALIYAGMFLYQKAYLQSLADKSAQRGAAIWNNPSRDMIIGMIEDEKMHEAGLYWRILDSKANSVKEPKIEEFIKYYINLYGVLGEGDNIVAQAQIYDYVIYKKLKVTVSSTYDNPVPGILGIFGIGDRFDLSAVSYSVINEPSEFIRNTDFGIDTGKEIDRKYLNGSISNYNKGVKDTFTKVLAQIKDFLD